MTRRLRRDAAFGGSYPGQSDCSYFLQLARSFCADSPCEAI
jgi:hypothetical protein